MSEPRVKGAAIDNATLHGMLSFNLDDLQDAVLDGDGDAIDEARQAIHTIVREALAATGGATDVLARLANLHAARKLLEAREAADA